jgi:hypothetical protein
VQVRAYQPTTPPEAVGLVTDQHRGQRLDRAQLDRVVASSRTVRDVIATLTGNDRLTARLQKLYPVAHVRHPGLPRLDTAGPVLGRHLELAESTPPYRVLALCTELIVPARLPHPLAAAAATSVESFDRLLDAADVEWHTELVTGPEQPAGTGTACPPTTALAVRPIWIGTPSPAPCALVSEELHLAPLISTALPAVK